MAGDSVAVSVAVENTGYRACREVVRLYVRDEVSTVIPREKELRGFRIAELAPGERKRITFRLPSEAFMTYDREMRHVLELGKFQLLTGPDAENLQGVGIVFRQ